MSHPLELHGNRIKNCFVVDLHERARDSVDVIPVSLVILGDLLLESATLL